jgi:hypothetical protein
VIVEEEEIVAQVPVVARVSEGIEQPTGAMGKA